MDTAIQRTQVSVQPQRSIRSDRKRAITGVTADIFSALEGCKRLSRTRCPQSDRLTAAQEHLEKAKSLVLQIALLDGAV